VNARTNFEAGDLVVCIDAALPPRLDGRHFSVLGRIKAGCIYRVCRPIWVGGSPGIELVGVDHRPVDGWSSRRFRKLRPADSGFADCLLTLTKEEVDA
jgi:hypothetical protein